jgi:hypothetical protein
VFRTRKRAVRRLSYAVERLPEHTRRAMLAALGSDTPLIAGAYARPGLGVCPLLAAHRRGGREHGRSTFAGEWDRFTRKRTRRARLITEQERRVLESLVRESLLPSDALPEPAAPTARQAIVARVPSTPPSGPGDMGRDADRSAELSSFEGWAWLGVYRRLDDYEAALAALRELEESERGTATVLREEPHSPPPNEATRCFVES